MRKFRRLVLASIVIAGICGGFAKLATGSLISNESYVIDFSKLPKAIGPFVTEAETNRDGSLELRSVQCEGSIFVNAHSIKEPPPEAFTELVYPPNKWRTLYVFRGQIYDRFTRIPAYLRLVLLRAGQALSMSARNLSDEYFFVFHFPAECPVDRDSVVAASSAILDLGASKASY